MCVYVHSQSELCDVSGSHGGSPVALGTRHTATNLTCLPQMCILCQEEQELTHTGRSLVLCAYVQRYDCCLQCFDAFGWAAGRASGL